TRAASSATARASATRATVATGGKPPSRARSTTSAATRPVPAATAVAVAAATSIGAPVPARGTRTAIPAVINAVVTPMIASDAFARPDAFRIEQETDSSARQHSAAARIGSAGAPTRYSGL